MELLDRILRLIRANVTSLISKAEDPEKVLEETVEQMQQNLVEMRQAVAQAIATQKRTERQCSQNESKAEEWYRRAQLALQTSDDNLAREALTKRKSYQETAASLQEQLTQQNEIVSRLKQEMRSLELKISEAKTKKDMYIARARSAQATQRIGEMIGAGNTSTTVGAFERMEDKVIQLEAQAEAIAELSTDDLKKKFISLEGVNDIDSELASMKAQVSPGNESLLPAPQKIDDKAEDLNVE